MNFEKSLKLAFSLAEVLVTLMIIGVISITTIPALLQNLNDQQLKTAWKREYSNISQALTLLKEDHGGNFKECFAARNLYHILTKYFNITKDCVYSNCFHIETTPVFNYKTLNGDPSTTNLFDDGQFFLNNGTFIAIENKAPDSTSPIVIWVDVNGPYKKPNTIGRDVFGIQLFEDTFKPLGAEGTYVTYFGSVENTCNTTSGERSGMGCSAQYLYE